MAKQIAIDHVFKVFGNDPKTALNLVKQGRSKQEILAQTGQSIGVFDADFTIESGEMTPTLKLKRNIVQKERAAAIDSIYS